MPPVLWRGDDMCYVYRYQEGFGTDERGRITGNHIHYNRRRWCMTPEGVKVHAMTTRYAWKMARRNATGPRGGRALEEHPRWVYYLEGRFYRSERVQTRPNEWSNVIVPLEGRMWDIHPQQSAFEGIPSAAITCEDGWPVRVELDGTTYDMDESMWPMCEELLGIMVKPKAKCGRKPKAVA